MKKSITFFVMMLLMAGLIPAYGALAPLAEEIAEEQAEEMSEDALPADSIAFAEDSLEQEPLYPDPEWYVAPVDREVSLAPRRAAANDCPVDSLLTFDVDSNLVSVTTYEYGDTTRTMVWAVNLDGSRVGQSRTESGENGGITFSATYDWDGAANDWKGTEKSEMKYYASGKMEWNTTFTWLNGAWVADQKLAYAYDASNRETEFVTYTRNAATNELVPSKARFQEWYGANKKTYEINYTAYTNGAWSAGTKKEWAYDGAGNNIEYTYYSSYSGNDNWVGSTHEVWEYTGTKKTYYAKQTWSNGGWVNSSKEIWAYNAKGSQTLYEKYTGSDDTWVGSSKEIWEFNAANSQTLHEKFGWSNDDWAINLREIKGYNEYGKNNLVENYSFTNGVQKGTKKEEYILSGNTNTKISTTKYSWTNGEWVYSTWSLSNSPVAEPANTTETCTYTWSNGAWVGAVTRTLSTKTGGKETEKITQSWSSTANGWVNSKRVSTTYSGAKKTQEAKYDWSADLNDWIGTARSDWHYNAKGLEDTVLTYRPVGTEWVDSLRTVKTYNEANTNIMTHNAKWNSAESKWVMQSMTRSDIREITEDGIRQTLNASWQCGSDSVWEGVQKDSTAYLVSINKQIYEYHSGAWENGDWVPSYRIEMQYDEAGRKILHQRFEWYINKWLGNSKYEYEYDALGNELMNALYLNWNTTTNDWIGTTKTVTVYNSNNKPTSKNSYTWANGGWENLFSYTYHYDASNREILQIVQRYTSGEWENTDKYEKEFSGSTQTKSNEYIWLNSDWAYRSRNESYYDTDAQAKLRREIHGSWNNGVVSSFTDDHYYYDCDVPSYTIRFENYDGTLLYSAKVKEGRIPAYKGETPTKPSDEQNTYSFAGWDSEIVAATANKTYTATFTATAIQNNYTITWLNEDGSQLAQTEVASGTIPAYNGETPSKAATAQYTYMFSGWTPEPVAATVDATYTATFSSTTKSYTIIFKNGEEVLQSSEVEYGTIPAYTGETPTKAADAQYTYSFAGWDAELVAVTGEATYTAQFTSTLNKYAISFVNYDGTPLQSSEVEYGAIPAYNGETPAKPATAQYTYTFKGWTPVIAEVAGDATYTADFDSVVNTYTIIFYFEDGTTVLERQTLAYGEMPSISLIPSKPSDGQYTYNFAGWNPAVEAVTGDASYTATYTAVLNQYAVIFVNYDGTQLQNTLMAYGDMPVYNGETPTKPSDPQYSYIFIGWDKELMAVTGEVVYTAVFESEINRYTVIFYDEDGVTELDRVEVEFGQMPVTTVVPTKEDDEQFTYTFAGWTPELTIATGDAAYTAVYTATPKSEAIQMTEAGEKATKMVIDGHVYILRGGILYTPTGAQVQ